MSLFNVNQITILGNIVRVNDLRYSAGGTAVLGLSVATNHSVKKNDAWESEPTFHDVICFGKAAEAIANMAKGSKVFVQGRLQKRSYENKDGQTVYVAEVVAEKIINLSDNKFPQPTQSNQTTQEDVSSDVPF